MRDKRISKLPPSHFRRDESSIPSDPGPFVAKVKNNLDPTRSGRLQVWIPDLGAGQEEKVENWRTVSYASPFFGSTYQDDNEQNAFQKVKHTYGMWFVPPDIGNFVLCTFVAGDANRGFWFACVPNMIGHHMVPGMAGSPRVDTSQIDDPIVASVYPKSPNDTVVAEFNENKDIDWANFVNLPKPIHEEHVKVLIAQGLYEDYIRGIISSSSQREMPSAVFGISTPGRAIKDPEVTPALLDNIEKGTLYEKDYAIRGRKGGHQFVMDDGNWQDKDRLIRLRTSGGHQILMNDSEHILYIGNSDGSAWIELTGPGHMNIYTTSSVNVRAQSDINLHADNDININAGNNINVSAGKTFNLQSMDMNINAGQTLTMFGSTVGIGSSGSLNLNATGTGTFNGSSGLFLTGSLLTLNEGGAVGIRRPDSLTMNKLPDTGKEGNVWKSVDNALSSIVPIAPTHEPWKLHMETTLAGYTVATSGQAATATPGGVVPGGTTATAASATPTVPGAGVTSGSPPAKNLPVVECKGGSKPTDAGPAGAESKGVINPVNKSYINRADNPDPPGTVGPLTAAQTKGLMTQLGWNESGFNYSAVNQYNFSGKYQFGAAALADLGYIKLDAYKLAGNKCLDNPSSWTTKAQSEGVDSKQAFLKNGPFQEKAMYNLLKANYNTLTTIGGIKPGDDQCTVAGSLAAAHLLGAGGSKIWRNTGGGQDANGTTGTTYFNMGRYAVDVLAAPKTA